MLCFFFSSISVCPLTWLYLDIAALLTVDIFCNACVFCNTYQQKKNIGKRFDYPIQMDDEMDCITGWILMDRFRWMCASVY